MSIFPYCQFYYPPFDHLLYPSKNLYPHLPIPTEVSPWTICLPKAELWISSEHPAPGTLAVLKHTRQPDWDRQGLGPGDRGFGYMLLDLVSTSESETPMFPLPAMLPSTLPLLLRTGTDSCEETELGPIVKGAKGKGLWRP